MTSKQASPTEPTASLDEILRAVYGCGVGNLSQDEAIGEATHLINKTYIKRSDVVGMLPEKYYIDDSYKQGYNDCIDTITNALGEGHE